MDREQRLFETALELCSMDDSDNMSKIIGHGAVFNKRSENLGGFREIIAPGAFDDVLNDDCRAFFNHDPNFILGRTTSGTLRLGVDERGLNYEVDAPMTQTIRDLVLTPMQRGDITQSSFGFRIKDDDWEEDDEGVIIRTVHRVQRLFDVSPVSIPAYPDAASAVRSLQQWQEARNGGTLKQALAKRNARERILQMLSV